MRTALVAVLTGVLVMGGFSALLAQEADWQTEMDAKLSKSLSVEFDGVELNKALAYFRERTKVNIILDPGRNPETMPRVTLRLTEVQGESALAWTVRLAGFAYVVRDQAVLVAPSGSIDPEWRREMRARYARRLGDQKRGWMRKVDARLRAEIKVLFRNDPIDRVAEQLAAKSGLNIVVDAESAKTAHPVNFQADPMTVENAIRWATNLSGLRYTIRDEVVYIASQRNMVQLQLETGTAAVPARFRQAVSFDFREIELIRALNHLQQISGVVIEVPNPPQGPCKLTLSGQDVELDRAVRLVLDRVGLTYAISYRGNVMVVVLQEGKVPKKTP